MTAKEMHAILRPLGVTHINDQAGHAHAAGNGSITRWVVFEPPGSFLELFKLCQHYDPAPYYILVCAKWDSGYGRSNNFGSTYGGYRRLGMMTQQELQP